jgi:hypothetical protein
MTHFTRTPGVVIVLFMMAASTQAQNVVNPLGRWEGQIRAPFGEVPITLDIWRDDAGRLSAAFSRGDGAVSGFPLTDVELKGNDLRLELKASGGGIFRGSVVNNAIAGTFAAFAGTVPFDVRRTGEPHIVKAPVNAAISTRLTGTWTARLSAGSEQTTFTMTLANTSTGSATAIIADDHGVNVPLTITEDGAHVSFEIISAKGTFTGLLNDGATAITGNYREGPIDAPLTFTRVR